MATLQSTPPVKKAEKSGSTLELSSKRIEPFVEGVEETADVVGKKKKKRTKKSSAAAGGFSDSPIAVEEGVHVSSVEKQYAEGGDNMESLQSGKERGNAAFVVETPGVRSERQRGVNPIGRNLRKSPTWQVPSDSSSSRAVGGAGADRDPQMRTRERMNKVHHIGFEGTYTVPAGGGSYENKGREKDVVDPLQQEPGIYMKNNFGPYVDPGERWVEKDEDGVITKDPVELRNRRRNRPTTDSTGHNGLYVSLLTQCI